MLKRYIRSLSGLDKYPEPHPIPKFRLKQDNQSLPVTEQKTGWANETIVISNTEPFDLMDG